VAACPSPPRSFGCSGTVHFLRYRSHGSGANRTAARRASWSNLRRPTGTACPSFPASELRLLVAEVGQGAQAAGARLEQRIVAARVDMPGLRIPPRDNACPPRAASYSAAGPTIVGCRKPDAASGSPGSTRTASRKHVLDSALHARPHELVDRDPSTVTVRCREDSMKHGQSGAAPIAEGRGEHRAHRRRWR
jgi:hypothetical protein